MKLYRFHEIMKRKGKRYFPKRYFQKISVPVLWCERIQAEHVGVVRKESFMNGRGITSSAR
jgi:hypothetical protein